MLLETHTSRLALALLYFLACVAQGTQRENLLQQLHRHRRADSEDRLHSDGRREVRGSLHPLKDISLLLLSLNPASAYHCFGLGSCALVGEAALVHSLPALLRRSVGRQVKMQDRNLQMELLQLALQSHSNELSAALDAELQSEMEASQSRLSEWSVKKLIQKGYTCTDLVVSGLPKVFFMEVVIRLAPASGQDLPYSRLGNGDLVMVSLDYGQEQQGPPSHTGDVIEASIVDRTSKSFRVSLPEAVANLVLSQGNTTRWRLDMLSNTVSHKRKQEAVRALASTRGFPPNSNFSPLKRALADLAKGESPEIFAKYKGRFQKPLSEGQLRADRPRPAVEELNPSQRAAIEAALSRTLTLWQGPPGTGKTVTTCALIDTAVSLLSTNDGPRILASCASNVAVDNILMGLLRLPDPPNVVRIGSPASTTAGLRNHTLEAKVAKRLTSINISAISEKARSMDAAVCREVLQAADVVLATTVMAGSPVLAALEFDICIIDEATQATEPDVLCAICKAHSAVLVGDPAQLPPTVISPKAMEANLHVSLFERLTSQGLTPLLLDTQYRMHPGLAEFPSRAFYDGRIKSHLQASDMLPPVGFDWPSTYAPVAFVQCDGSEVKAGTSFLNDKEAYAVVDVIKGLVDSGAIKSFDDVGIVTPYVGQVRLLHNHFVKMGYATSVAEDAVDSMFREDFVHPDDQMLPGSLEIRSVDAYQGREKEIMVLSAVRANNLGQLGFVADKRRLNVAITRARRGLVVVGDFHTLRQDPSWSEWFNWINEKEAFTRKPDAIDRKFQRAEMKQTFEKMSGDEALDLIQQFLERKD